MPTHDEYTAHLTTTGKYTRQRWRCRACGARGEVLFHVSDAPGTRQLRLEVSHRALVRRDRCSSPDFFLIPA